MQAEKLAAEEAIRTGFYGAGDAQSILLFLGEQAIQVSNGRFIWKVQLQWSYGLIIYIIVYI